MSISTFLSIHSIVTKGHLASSSLHFSISIDFGLFFFHCFVYLVFLETILKIFILYIKRDQEEGGKYL